MAAENSFRKQHKVRAAVAAILGATAVSGLSAPGWAQDRPGAASSGTVTLEEVTVTGSRIKRTNDFNTPTPTTVVDQDVMNSLGIVNVGSALQVTPANISTFTPANTGNSSFFTGAYIPDLRGLNPFFGTRTLTLIDTRRAVQTTQGDSFDLNFIPQILVQRIDTVTGGASAAYGSGAISGVINVILDDKLEGGKINADMYQTSYSDGRDRHVAAAFGHGMMDGRVHFVIGAEYEKQDAVGCQDARRWCAQDVGLYQTGALPQATGGTIATYSLGRNLRNNVISDAGAFFPPAGNPGLGIGTLQASGDGTGVVPFVTGTSPLALSTTPGASVTNNTTVVGGDGNPLYKVTNLMAPVTRGVITGMLNGKLTDSINFSADVNWGKVESTVFVPGNTSQPTILPAFGLTGQNIVGNTTHYNDFVSGPATVTTLPNAYLGTGSLADAVNNGYVALNKDWTGQIPLAAITTTTVRRFSAGLDGKFGDSSWSWEAYGEYGLTRREQFEPNEIRAASYQMALDSVIGPDGQPECRVTAAGGIQNLLDPANPYYNPTAAYAVTGVAAGFPIPSPVLATNSLLAQGCVPINPFGTQSVASASQAYAFGNLDERLRYEQTVAAFNASGDIWDGLGAGAFSLAAGFEWRHEVGRNDEIQSCLPGDDAATCAARSQDFAAQFGTPFAGGVTVDEAYVEANLPLLKDLPGAHLLTVDVAARESRYKTDAEYGITYDLQPDLPRSATHDLTTWKVSALYEPLEGVRFRGSQSRDSRAANFRELYYGQQLQSGATGGFGYCSHLTSVNIFDDPCTQNLFGNVNLRPEISDTTTLGIVLTPSFAPGLQFSADWFHIRIKDAISAANTPEVELACQQGNAGSCSQMEFNNTIYDSKGNVYGPASTGPQLSGAAAWQAGIDNATVINAFAYNGAFYDTRGVDFSLNYLTTLPDGSSLNTRLVTTWTGEQVYQNYPGGPVFNILGQTGAGAILTDNAPAARWRGNLSLTWTRGALSLTPSMNWVGHGTLDAYGVTPQQADLYRKVVDNDASIRGYGYILLPYNYVPSYFVFNMNGTLSFDNVAALKNVQLFVQVNNVLNRKPPFASAPIFFGNAYAGTNPVYFDTLGLATRVGFRVTF